MSYLFECVLRFVSVKSRKNVLQNDGGFKTSCYRTHVLCDILL